MIFTNKHDLPRPYVLAATNDSYSKGNSDYSVTELLSPPQKARLEHGFSDKITQDVSDRMWSMVGTAMHIMLERCDFEAVKTETRLTINFDGLNISGQIDRLSNEGLLSDYKSTSVWSVIYGKDDYENNKRSRFTDYEEQLNLYALLLTDNGFEVASIEAWLLLRDWQANELKRATQRGSYYPPIPWYTFKARLWSYEEQQQFLHERLRVHRYDTYENPISCTDDERWTQPTKYAVMKEGRKTALRVLDSWDSACDWISENGHERGVKGIGIEVRPGRYTRCEDYCNAAPFCPQFTSEIPVKTPLGVSK